MKSLKEVRKQAHLTQVDAAKLVGVSRRTYQTYEENDLKNDTYDELLTKLKEMGITPNGPALLNVKYIKNKTSEIFANYPEVKCAYLYGSYARGEATVKSDVDLLIVSDTMGLKFYKLASDLEDALGKTVDLISHRQLDNNLDFLTRVLVEGVKIYGQNANPIKNRFNP
ncbi:MAG: nucleotidyltransferase domain-containing protein [Bacilli bacterium]|nr:nucleotidyltransferase domain-containing protein [Bacilli bacterium]